MLFPFSSFCVTMAKNYVTYTSGMNEIQRVCREVHSARHARWCETDLHMQFFYTLGENRHHSLHSTIVLLSLSALELFILLVVPCIVLLHSKDGQRVRVQETKMTTNGNASVFTVAAVSKHSVGPTSKPQHIPKLIFVYYISGRLIPFLSLSPSLSLSHSLTLDPPR